MSAYVRDELISVFSLDGNEKDGHGAVDGMYILQAHARICPAVSLFGFITELTLELKKAGYVEHRSNVFYIVWCVHLYSHRALIAARVIYARFVWTTWPSLHAPLRMYIEQRRRQTGPVFEVLLLHCCWRSTPLEGDRKGVRRNAQANGKASRRAFQNPRLSTTYRSLAGLEPCMGTFLARD